MKWPKEASSITASDLAFEQDRQDDDVERRRLAEARADLDVVVGHVGEQDALLLEGALPDQALAGGGTGWRGACAR